MTNVPVALTLPPPENNDEGKRTVAHIISCIFPKPTLGQDFFKHFIERAQQDQVTLPDEPASIAVICTKSIATLGKELGFSHDTTHKYVVIFKALGLLKKRNVMEQEMFVLTTGIYHAPETLEANLDHLILHIQHKKSRGKFHQLLIDVKQRCLVYKLIAQDVSHTFALLENLLHPVEGETKLRLERRIVQAQYLVSTLAVHIVQRSHHPERQWVDSVPQGKQEQAQTGQPQEFAPTLTGAWVDSVPQVDQTGQPQESAPTLTGAWVDSSSEDQASCTPLASTHTPLLGRRQEAPLAMLEDMSKNLPRGASTQKASEGRFAQERLGENLPDMLHQIDSARLQQPENLPFEPTMGRLSSSEQPKNLPIATKSVDSVDPLRNVNVDIIHFFITFTLREPRKVAEFLAEQFEGDTRVYPKYRKLFTIQPGQPRDARVLVAAFICTMVHLHKDAWKLDHPGGYFTRRCREYDAGIPEEVEEWIAQYGTLSCAQFLAVLTQPGRKQAHTGPTQAQSTIQVSISQPAPAPKVLPLTLAPQMHADPTRMVLSKDEASELMRTILQDVRPQPFRMGLVRIGKAQPRYAVLVDAFMPGSQTVDQLLIYTKQEWQMRLAAKTSWYSLFHPTK